MSLIKWITACELACLLMSSTVCCQPDSAATPPVPSTSGASPLSENVTPGLHVSKGLSPTRLAIIGGTLGAVMATTLIYQNNGYWRDNREPFHFQEDLQYALHVDKIAHFWDSALLTYVFAKSFEWANMEESDAWWWGAGTSLFFNTFAEIQDGRSAWGFDRVDWAANVAGAAFPLIKYYAPDVRNFDIKWTYLPSKNLDTQGAFPGQRHLIFDDYEGYSFWLSVKTNNLLPKSLEPYWPDFLCLAAGYRARDIIAPQPYREYLIGLDLDMTKVIPSDTWFLRTLGEALNFIRFPLPAVKISDGVVWYGIYF